MYFSTENLFLYQNGICRCGCSMNPKRFGVSTPRKKMKIHPKIFDRAANLNLSQNSHFLYTVQQLRNILVLKFKTILSTHKKDLCFKRTVLPKSTYQFKSVQKRDFSYHISTVSYKRSYFQKLYIKYFHVISIV